MWINVEDLVRIGEGVLLLAFIVYGIKEAIYRKKHYKNGKWDNK